MRLRACQVYGVYGNQIKYKIENHLQKIAEGIFNNMQQD
jgi:hypothetical protein